MKSKFAMGVALLVLSSAAAGQETKTTSAPDPAPLVVQPQTAPSNVAVLPANTEVMLSLNETLTTKGKRLHEGDTFDMTVVQDVMLGDYVVIPKGARASGQVTWLTDKGMFGKSGKMDIEMRYVEVGGRRIPLTGSFRQEGEGNTVATVAGVALVPVAGLFITGKSGTIPAGRELLARTRDDLPVQFAGAAPVRHPLVAQPKAETEPLAPPAPQPAVVTEPTPDSAEN